MTKRAAVVEPIRRSVTVSWAPEAAFRRFTADFGSWWPAYALSIGGRRVRRIVFECRVGGRIYEEHHDGTRFQWGIVTVLEPPTRVVFTHHASRDAADAQRVEVTFSPEGSGTRVDLVASGWEKMTAPAQRARGGYQMTWKAALDRFAGRFGGTMLFFGAMAVAIDVLGQRGTFVRNSLSRISNAGENAP
jgi:uncharacterized protein YndB with AHSA1/START domain